MSARRRRDGPVEQGILGLDHPPLETAAEISGDLLVAGLVDHVPSLAGVEEQVVEGLAADDPLRPATRQVRVLAGTVVAVREDRVGVVVEAADVLEALGADRPLRLVRGVVGQLGEDLGAGARRLLVPDERNQRAARQPRWRVDSRDLADRREDVDVGDELVARVAAIEAGAAQDQHHADAAIEEARLGRRERESVIGGADHERVPVQPRLVQLVEDRPDPVVQRSRAGFVGRHIQPDLGRVREERRRQRVDTIAH